MILENHTPNAPNALTIQNPSQIISKLPADYVMLLKLQILHLILVLHLCWLALVVTL